MTTSKSQIDFELTCVKESVRSLCPDSHVRSFADFVNDMWACRHSFVIGLSVAEAGVIASSTWRGWIRRTTLWLFRSWTVKLPDNVLPAQQGPSVKWSVPPTSSQDGVKSMDHLLGLNEKFHSKVSNAALNVPLTVRSGSPEVTTAGTASTVAVFVDSASSAETKKRKSKRVTRPQKCACLMSQTCPVCAKAKKAFFEKTKLSQEELKRRAKKYLTKQFGDGAVLRSVKQFRPDSFEVVFKRRGRRLLSKHSVAVKTNRTEIVSFAND